MSKDDKIEDRLAKLLEAATELPVGREPRPADIDNEVWVYAIGILTCSVCAPGGMDRDVVARQVNAKTPTGISSRWRISSDTHFKSGETMPCTCQDAPNRKHWLLEC